MDSWSRGLRSGSVLSELQQFPLGFLQDSSGVPLIYQMDECARQGGGSRGYLLGMKFWKFLVAAMNMIMFSSYREKLGQCSIQLQQVL